MNRIELLATANTDLSQERAHSRTLQEQNRMYERNDRELTRIRNENEELREGFKTLEAEVLEQKQRQ